MTRPWRAFSIRRPWANLIMAGHKRVENRTWSTRYRGNLVLHAGKAFDGNGISLASRLGITGFDRPHCPAGYLGTARLVDVHPADGCCAPWGEPFPDVYHWVLADIVAYAHPVAGPGQLGLYRVPDVVTDHRDGRRRVQAPGTPALFGLEEA